MCVLFQISGTVSAFGDDHCIHHSVRASVTKLGPCFMQKVIIYLKKIHICRLLKQHVQSMKAVILFRCLRIGVFKRPC